MPRSNLSRLCLMFCVSGFLGLAALATGARGPAAAADPVRVVVTIKPIHSLVAGVMQGVSEPRLLIAGGGSPHAYSLKPSDAAALREAQVVVRVSDQLESFLAKPIQSLAKEAQVVTIDELDGIQLLEPREGGVWEEHEHDHEAAEAEAGHAGEEAHAKTEHEHEGGEEQHAHEGEEQHTEHHEHEEGEEQHAEAGSHEHEHEHEHHHDGHDTHLWLDPHNAERIVTAIAEALGQADPANAKRYEANAAKMLEDLEALDAELKTATQPLAGKRFIVFHDAYHYFEKRYGLQAAGSITVSPERQPGARRLSEIKEKIIELGATCVFAEPQFEPKLVKTVVTGTEAKSGVLDPLGAAEEAGPELYFKLMRGLVTSLSDCLE